MGIKFKQRTNDTLRLIKMQYEREGRSPHLTAISTIYQNLLVQNAQEDTWQLFHKVASLPLKTTRLEVSCIAEGGCCEQRAKRNHCMHRMVEVPHMVNLEPVDHYLFEKGRKLDPELLAQWWGQQLAEALSGKVSP